MWPKMNEVGAPEWNARRATNCHSPTTSPGRMQRDGCALPAFYLAAALACDSVSVEARIRIP